jgi:hypothetical protein
MMHPPARKTECSTLADRTCRVTECAPGAGCHQPYQQQHANQLQPDYQLRSTITTSTIVLWLAVATYIAGRDWKQGNVASWLWKRCTRRHSCLAGDLEMHDMEQSWHVIKAPRINGLTHLIPPGLLIYALEALGSAVVSDHSQECVIFQITLRSVAQGRCVAPMLLPSSFAGIW